MRIAVGGIEHESASFTPVQTPLSEFTSPENYRSSEALLRSLGQENTVIEGMIAGVREQEMNLVPLIHSDGGGAGGQPTLATYQAIKGRLLEALQGAGKVDGVLLSLHGAFSAQGMDDCDGDVAAEVRNIVGPSCPIIVVHDQHCNIGPLLIENVDAVIVEKTYPHVDMADRGREAAALMAQTLRGQVKPSLAYRSLPMFWSAPKMITDQEPIRTVMERIFATEAEPGVLTASLGVGYQWADVPVAGVSTVVVTDGDPALAQRKADELAAWLWQRRADWQSPTVPPAKALAEGEKKGKYPIVLADQADNPGGGAPSDGTEILRLFVDRRLKDAAVLYICDPHTGLGAMAAGLGATINARIGGKSTPAMGPPVCLSVQVEALSDGRFVYDGPMWRGVEDCVGDSARLRHQGIQVVVTSKRQQPVDLAFCRTLGLDYGALRYICVKSTGHFRSGFGPIAGSIFNVDAAGVLSQDLTKLPFKRLGRKVYPIHQDAELCLNGRPS